MNQQELDREYDKFMTKLIEKGQEFINDFKNLSNKNKQRFQNVLSKKLPGGMATLEILITTNFDIN